VYANITIKKCEDAKSHSVDYVKSIIMH
jgi:hypothetical protein